MTDLLRPYDPDWPARAEREAARWRAALGGALETVHHIGSTSVPGLAAKPIIDLIPVFRAGQATEIQRPAIEAMGYDWLGTYGLPRRSYCRRNDPATGQRLFHAHGYASGDPEIRRHLAFRDALRADPALARDYEARKRACAALHPDDGSAYGRCKSNWIDTIEARALEGLS